MNRLDEKFYVGEEGLTLLVRTGMDMTGVREGDVRSALRRPNGSVVSRVIPVSAIQDAEAGLVAMSIEAGDFSMPGVYQAQIYFRDREGRLRPSHLFAFEVENSIVVDSESLFS